MATVHVIFMEGPMHGAIHTYQDPPDQIEFLVELDRREDGDVAVYAQYRKVRVEPAGKDSPMRGMLGHWTWTGNRFEEVGDGN